MFPEIIEYCYYKYHQPKEEDFTVVKAESSLSKEEVALFFNVAPDELKNSTSNEYKEYLKKKGNE